MYIHLFGLCAFSTEMLMSSIQYRKVAVPVVTGAVVVTMVQLVALVAVAGTKVLVVVQLPVKVFLEELVILSVG